MFKTIKKTFFKEPSQDNIKPVLFSGHDEYYKELASTAKVYAEYGCGKSTFWIYENTKAQIYAADTSKEWADKVKDQINDSERLKIKWIDVGKLSDWGRPKSYDKRDNFINYVLFPWQQNLRPDFILIDGRFRVSCFCFSLLHATPGTIIFFDDYVHRHHYHIVEELVKPSYKNERMACFVVPKSFNMNLANMLANQFLYVLE